MIATSCSGSGTVQHNCVIQYPHTYYNHFIPPPMASADGRPTATNVILINHPVTARTRTVAHNMQCRDGSSPAIARTAMATYTRGVPSTQGRPPPKRETCCLSDASWWVLLPLIRPCVKDSANWTHLSERDGPTASAAKSMALCQLRCSKPSWHHYQKQRLGDCRINVV